MRSLRCHKIHASHILSRRAEPDCHLHATMREHTALLLCSDPVLTHHLWYSFDRGAYVVAAMMAANACMHCTYRGQLGRANCLGQPPHLAYLLEPAPVISFPKLNKTLLGYFDPKNVTFYDVNEQFMGLPKRDYGKKNTLACSSASFFKIK